MSQDRAFQASSGGATLVLVLPALTQSASGPSIASALERAAEALRAGPTAQLFAASQDSEATLMRRVEAEVYGAD